jgi:hypothetical protein
MSPNICSSSSLTNRYMALLAEGGAGVQRVYKHGPPDGGRIARRSRLIRWTHVVSVGLDNLETRDFEPVLGFGVSLSAMDVYRFVPFIGLKRKTASRESLESL